MVATTIVFGLVVEAVQCLWPRPDKQISCFQALLSPLFTSFIWDLPALSCGVATPQDPPFFLSQH